MITTEKIDKPNWFNTLFQVNGSVALMILPRIAAFAVLALVVSFVYSLDPPYPFQTLGNLTTNVIYNLILGLLLVFRTNTSYDRFWEGRKAWGTLVVNIRNLAREIRLGIPENKKADLEQKIPALKLLGAFAIAAKLHLRGEPINEELKELISPSQVKILESSDHRPLQIIYWIRSFFQDQVQLNHLDRSQLSELNSGLNNLTEGLSSCERIITTPIPIAYRVYLKRLILIYCLGLPFKLVPDLQWWSVLIVAIVSFILLGVEEVGRELENPFGNEANDLPLDDICDTILSNIESTIHMPSQDISEALSNQHPDFELQEAS